MKLKVKKLYPDAKVPTRGTPHSAGLDLYFYGNEFVDKIVVYPNTTEPLRVGIATAIEEGYHAKIRERSGMAKTRLLVSAGLIDSDYRGEWIVMVNNYGTEKIIINRGDRIGQFVIYKNEEVDLEVLGDNDELDETSRGTGGFGSTGK